MVGRYYRWRKRSRFVWMLIGILAVVTPVSTRGADVKAKASVDKVRIAYSSISGTMAPGWVAYEAGLFRRQGLDAEFVFVKGGSKAVKALVSGEVDFAQVAGVGVMRSNLKGSDAVMIAGFLNTMNYEFIVSKEISRPEQLKGKTVAVSRFGGSSDFATRYALEKFGLAPEKDVKILEIGSQPDRMAALQEGKVQGVMLAVPLSLEAKALGFPVLTNLQALGLEYQHTALATTGRLIEKRPELVRKVMRAYAEGIHYYKTHRKEALAVLSKYLTSGNNAALAETYEVLGLMLLPEKLYPTLRGIEITLDRLAEKDPKAREAKPARFVDLRFVDELEKSGFIDRLYVVASRQEATVAPVVLKGQAKKDPNTAKSGVVSKPVASRQEATVAPVVLKGQAKKDPNTAKSGLASKPVANQAMEVSTVVPKARANDEKKATADKRQLVLSRRTADTSTRGSSPRVESQGDGYKTRIELLEKEVEMLRTLVRQKAELEVELLQLLVKEKRKEVTRPVRGRQDGAKKVSVARKPVGGQSETPAVREEYAIQVGEEYVIQNGDTLSLLATKFYGVGWKWAKIYEANKGTLADPNMLYLGQRILIPPDDQPEGMVIEGSAEPILSPNRKTPSL